MTLALRRLVVALPLLGWLLTGLLSVVAIGNASNERFVVRVRAVSVIERRRLAQSGLDLLEMRDGDDLFALVDQQRWDALRAAGWDARLDAEQTALLARAPEHNSIQPRGTPGYRSVEETYALMQRLVAAHPTLATLADYGDSYQKQAGVGGYDLLALRLSNTAIPGPKPVFVLMAAIHPREIVTDEVALRFVQYLLGGYGADADATWLLDEHEVVVIPVANPDGRHLVDRFDWYQRKNTRPTGTCGTSISNQSGVDLNRNASFRWGTVDSPFNTRGCELTYPGASPASEPETAALEAFVRTLFADRRGPGNNDPAPLDTSGVLISLHSYSDLVLWPWGQQASGPAPNAAGLARLGQRLAAFNGYTPFQAYNLYDTSGTTDDWSYGELGVASYTFEIGPTSGVCGGFFPPYACLDGEAGGSFWPRNLPALRYAARVARAPYQLPLGPDVTSLIVSDTQSVTLTAGLKGDEPINDAEAYLDASPWRGGKPVALAPTDGRFDTADEQVALSLGTGTGRERRLVLVRARSGNNWGPLSAAFVSVPTQQPYNTHVPLISR